MTTTLSDRYTALPLAWRQDPQAWFHWKVVEEAGKRVPKRHPGRVSYAVAYQRASTCLGLAGLGYYPPKAAPPYYVRIEIANCRGTTGELDRWVSDLLAGPLADAYCEVHPSQEGITALCQSDKELSGARQVAVPRTALRPALAGLLCPVLTLEPVNDRPVLLSGEALGHGDGRNCTPAIRDLMLTYVAPQPEVLEEEPPWEREVDIVLPKGPHLAPDRLPALMAHDPSLHGVWELWPGAVRLQQMDYTLALCTEAARQGWPLQELCQLALAHHAKHGWRPLDIRHYKELLFAAITAVVEHHPDYLGREVGAQV